MTVVTVVAVVTIVTVVVVMAVAPVVAVVTVVAVGTIVVTVHPSTPYVGSLKGLRRVAGKYATLPTSISPL